MRGKLAIMDHTGHTEILFAEMTDAEVLAKFHEIVDPSSKGGKGMILGAGADLSDMEQVRTEDEFLAIIAASEETGAEPKFLARGQVVGG